MNFYGNGGDASFHENPTDADCARKSLGMSPEKFYGSEASQQLHWKAVRYMETLKQTVLREKMDELRTRRSGGNFDSRICANKIKKKYGIY